MGFEGLVYLRSTNCNCKQEAMEVVQFGDFPAMDIVDGEVRIVSPHVEMGWWERINRFFDVPTPCGAPYGVRGLTLSPLITPLAMDAQELRQHLARLDEANAAHLRYESAQPPPRNPPDEVGLPDGCPASPQGSSSPSDGPETSSDGLGLDNPDSASSMSSVMSTLALSPRSSNGFVIEPIRTCVYDGGWVGKVKRGILRMFCAGDVADAWDQDAHFQHATSVELCRALRTPAKQKPEETLRNHVEQVNKQRIHHVPRIVAQATVALRMKLGIGATNRDIPGNVALVRAEAARLLRGWNVRTSDAAAHLVAIERCFFNDDTHFQLTNWRAKAVKNSRFMRWFLGSQDSPVFDY